MSAQNITDSDLDKKAKKTCEKISENIYILANEPTLACFRIQEHVCKTGPTLAEKGNEIRKLNTSLKGNVYDIEYTIKAIKQMPAANIHFKNTQELLKNALFFKQQLDYDENVRMRVASSTSRSQSQQSSTTATNTSKTGAQKKSAFQRFSGSFDTLFNTSFGGIASSASADLKDLKT
ncbi:protein MEF2BNB-like protein, partial [Leptotrombidium deliense]